MDRSRFRSANCSLVPAHRWCTAFGLAAALAGIALLPACGGGSSSSSGSTQDTGSIDAFGGAGGEDGESGGDSTDCEPELDPFFDVELPLLEGTLPYPPEWGADRAWPPEANPSTTEVPVASTISVPNGRPIYALIVSGYETNRHLDDLLVYNFATHLMAQGAYVHYAWWNNLLAPYMKEPLHHSDSYPGDLENDGSKFAGLTAPQGGVLRKAYPAEDFQFVADARRLLSAIRENNPSAIIILLGHSMGGSSVVHLASETEEVIDILAPIDPVNNRNFPWSGSFALNTLNEDFFNWTRWRVTRKSAISPVQTSDGFRGFKSRNIFCSPVGEWNPSLDEVTTGLCDWAYDEEAATLSFGSNIINLFHRWQMEFKFPFDYDESYEFGHVYPPDGLSTQREVAGIKSDPFFGTEPDPGGWPYGDFNPAYNDQCCPTDEGIAWDGDGHAEIVGFRGPINNDVTQALGFTRVPVPLGVRVKTSPECINCSPHSWPARVGQSIGGGLLTWTNPNRETRAQFLRDLEAHSGEVVGIDGDDNPILFEDAWEHRPFNPDLCLVSNGLIELFEDMNRPPTAVAGEDQTIECMGPGGTEVLLDASGSSDPDVDEGDVLSYTWTWATGSTTEPVIIVSLPLGTNCVKLIVEDRNGHIDEDVLTVTIADTTPPDLRVALSPNVLWPPNHKLVDIEAIVEADDVCGPVADLILLSIHSSDADDGFGDGHTTGDIAGAEIGTFDTSFQLRAERNGMVGRRVYTVTYQAIDESGNIAEVSAEVVVENP